MPSNKNFKEGFRKGVKTKFSFIIQKFLFNAVHFGTLGTNWVTLFSTNRVSGIITVIAQCQGKPSFLAKHNVSVGSEACFYGYLFMHRASPPPEVVVVIDNDDTCTGTSSSPEAIEVS